VIIIERYETSELIQLLDSDTIEVLFKVFNLNYKHIAIRLRCTPQNIAYKMKTNSWKIHEKKLLLELFRQHGLENLELILFHQITNKTKKVVY
jgi:hypothetical protein